jgi:hypothetical protein
MPTKSLKFHNTLLHYWSDRVEQMVKTNITSHLFAPFVDIFPFALNRAGVLLRIQMIHQTNVTKALQPCTSVVIIL